MESERGSFGINERTQLCGFKISLRTQYYQISQAKAIVFLGDTQQESFPIQSLARKAAQRRGVALQ